MIVQIIVPNKAINNCKTTASQDMVLSPLPVDSTDNLPEVSKILSPIQTKIGLKILCVGNMIIKPIRNKKMNLKQILDVVDHIGMYS